MKVELAVALVAGAVALACAGGTVWSTIRIAARFDANARDIEQLKIDSERLKAAAQTEARERQKRQELNSQRAAFYYAVAGQVRSFRDAIHGIFADTEFNDACSNVAWVASRYPSIPALFDSRWQELSLLPDRVQFLVYRAKISWQFIQQPDASKRPVDSPTKCIEFFRTRDRASSIMADADEIMAVLRQEPSTASRANP